MRRVICFLALFLGLGPGTASAQEHVTFATLAVAKPGQIDGYLFRPAGQGPHPAMVFLHGCGGLFNARRVMDRRQLDWAARLNGLGDVVLMVDSFTARGVSNMCAPANMQRDVFFARPGDAYGALALLQAQDFVQADRVGLMGWSEGGGATLFTVGPLGNGRPAALPQGDFRAAVAFYPASCSVERQAVPWAPRIPLLVLIGASDVWTPAPPCQSLIEAAARAGAPAEIHIYPDAYHDFDWPGMREHEIPAYRTRAGVVPITGTNEAARTDALARVPEFLARFLNTP